MKSQLFPAYQDPSGFPILMVPGIFLNRKSTIGVFGRRQKKSAIEIPGVFPFYGSQSKGSIEVCPGKEYYGSDCMHCMHRLLCGFVHPAAQPEESWNSTAVIQKVLRT